MRFLAVTMLAALAGCAAGDSPADPASAADLVLRGGKVVTVSDAMPEAQAIAMKGDTILAVGTDEDMAKYIGDATQVIELNGMLAVPGLIESHGHFLGIGDANMQLDVMHVNNWNDIVAMVGAAAKDVAPGTLIRGRGWHQEKWDTKPVPSFEGLPTHASLDSV
jgi:predicted amidohydrolase YtcJ